MKARGKWRLLGAALLVAAGGAACVWWHAMRASGTAGNVAADIRVEPVDEGFIGSRACAECHREIWEKYQGHPMASSLAAIADAATIEDYADQTTFSHPESRQYRVERASGGVVHHEIMTDDEGAVVYDQAVPVQYVLGSGKRGRSYLFERDGLVFASPIAWYSAARRWDAAPAYLPLTHLRFERRANDRCLSCHAGRLSYDRRLPDRYGAPAFQEESIGCERCHGPGAGHVRRRRSGRDSPADDDIVNPAWLDGPARGDICHQCHLQGDVRILRSGRSNHDFRPGQRLEDVWAVFVGGARVSGEGTTRAVNQVDQMRASVCFQSSAGRMECLSCHDPHGVPREAERAVFYSDRCLNCHRDRGCALPEAERLAAPAEGSCTDCHMPPLVASNVPHTSQTDHRIPRRPGAPPTPVRREWRFFDGADLRLPAGEFARARALFEIQQLDRRPDADTAERLVSALSPLAGPDAQDTDLLEAMGIVCAYQGRADDARRYWQRVLRIRPLHESVLQHLAVLESGSGNLAAAIDASRRLIRANPWNADVHVRLAQLLEESGDLQQAVTEAERGLEINPTLVPVRKWLIEAYRQMGQIDAARSEERTVKRMRGR